MKAKDNRWEKGNPLFICELTRGLPAKTGAMSKQEERDLMTIIFWAEALSFCFPFKTLLIKTLVSLFYFLYLYEIVFLIKL